MFPSKISQEKPAKPFPRGPWSTEPNEAEWEYNNLPCAILRVGWSGHLCGYIAVPQSHPLFGIGCFQEILIPSEKGDGSFLPGVGWFKTEYHNFPYSPHGGLTYARGSADGAWWWFGFNCAHSGDLTPKNAGDERFPHFEGDIYCDWQYVTLEVNSLAAAFSKVPPDYWDKLAQEHYHLSTLKDSSP